MTSEKCVEILEKMQFCEHTDFVHDATFGFGYSEEYKAIEHAIEILKKHIKMPYKMKYKETIRIEIDEPEDVDVFTFHCPCCDQELGDSDWDGLPTDEWLDFCENCGQKIDWMHDVDIPRFEREKKAIARKVVAYVKK